MGTPNLKEQTTITVLLHLVLLLFASMIMHRPCLSASCAFDSSSPASFAFSRSCTRTHTMTWHSPSLKKYPLYEPGSRRACANLLNDIYDHANPCEHDSDNENKQLQIEAELLVELCEDNVDVLVQLLQDAGCSSPSIDRSFLLLLLQAAHRVQPLNEQSPCELSKWIKVRDSN